MSKKKPTSGIRAKKKAEISLVRSSAAEYLTFVAASGQGGVEAVYADENVWLSQKMMGLLYDVDVRTISYHLQKIFADKELEEKSVIQFFRITAADGKTYDTGHYNLSAVIAVGYKVNSERAIQFRKWATGIIESFTIKGFAMDDERLKNDGSILGKKYFEEQLQRIREIRLSERKFYQKITDIYATSIDYDVTSAATQRFFATVQNKLHWANPAARPRSSSTSFAPNSTPAAASSTNLRRCRAVHFAFTRYSAPTTAFTLVRLRTFTRDGSSTAMAREPIGQSEIVLPVLPITSWQRPENKRCRWRKNGRPALVGNASTPD